jgi:hypothetical protein
MSTLVNLNSSILLISLQEANSRFKEESKSDLIQGSLTHYS